MNDFVSRFILVLCASAISLSVNSMAVGEVELYSHLNQPLDARIRILSASEEELSSLNIRLIENFDEVLDRRESGLTHEIINDDEGAYIAISSGDVIKEPFVNFNLELSWSEGHLIREYTLIIDPQ